MACPDCGLVQVLPVIRHREVAECRRCQRTLASPVTGRIEAPLTLAIAALLLFIPALMAPLLGVSTLGAHRDGWLSTGVRELWLGGFHSLAILVGGFSIVLPCVYLVLLIWVLWCLRSPGKRPIGAVFRWVQSLRSWMMLEVYLVGCFVAYSRIKVVTSVDVSTGGWCLLAATMLLLLALTQLDGQTVWQALPLRRNRPRGSSTIACTSCDLIVTDTVPGHRCPRCEAVLHPRKPGALQVTAALVATGYILYIPANVLPVLTIVRFGRPDQNTILSGVGELIDNDLWPLAVIVFVASIILPLLKLLGLTWMLLATWRRSERMLLGRTRFYRMIDLVGRWSNIDVFMVSVLAAVLRFGTVTEVHPGNGLVAFAAVVVVTMIATGMFDTRLMWDAPRSRA